MAVSCDMKKKLEKVLKIEIGSKFIPCEQVHILNSSAV